MLGGASFVRFPLDQVLGDKTQSGETRDGDRGGSPEPQTVDLESLRVSKRTLDGRAFESERPLASVGGAAFGENGGSVF